MAFVSTDVNRIAPFATAELAPVDRQSCSSLHPWHLTQTALASLGEGLHAIATAPIFHRVLQHLGMGTHGRIFSIVLFVVPIVALLTIFFLIGCDKALLEDTAFNRGLGLNTSRGCIRVDDTLIVTILRGAKKHLVMCLIVTTLEQNVGARGFDRDGTLGMYIATVLRQGS